MKHLLFWLFSMCLTKTSSLFAVLSAVFCFHPQELFFHFLWTNPIISQSHERFECAGLTSCVGQMSPKPETICTYFCQDQNSIHSFLTQVILNNVNMSVFISYQKQLFFSLQTAVNKQGEVIYQSRRLGKENGSTHSALWPGADSDPGYFSDPPLSWRNHHRHPSGACKHGPSGAHRFSRYRWGGRLPFFQEADGVLQSFVVLLQLLAAFVKHFQFLSVSRKGDKLFPTIEGQMISIIKHSMYSQQTYKQRCLFNLLTLASKSKIITHISN